MAQIVMQELSCGNCKHWEGDENALRGVCTKIDDRWLGTEEEEECEKAHIEPGADYPQRLETRGDFYCILHERREDDRLGGSDSGDREATQGGRGSGGASEGGV